MKTYKINPDDLFLELRRVNNTGMPDIDYSRRMVSAMVKRFGVEEEGEYLFFNG